MPSRKREKGRQRKAKAKAIVEGDLSWEEFAQRRKRINPHEQCLHTILAKSLADPGHPIQGFMDAYITIESEKKKAGYNFHKFVRNLFFSFPLTNDESQRKIVERPHPVKTRGNLADSVLRKANLSNARPGIKPSPVRKITSYEKFHLQF